VKRTESAVVLSRMAITPASRRFERSAKNQETVIPRMTVMAETVRRVIGVAIVHGLDEIE